MHVQPNWRPMIGARGLSFHDDARSRWWIAGWNRMHEPEIIGVADERYARLFLACNGSMLPAELAQQAGLTLNETMSTLADWGERLAGSIEWIGRVYDERRARIRELGFELLREAEAQQLESTRTNSEYYRDCISDPLQLFEMEEPTVAHAYSTPHVALGGRSYGEAFFDTVWQHGALGGDARILEIGCGTGRFARAFLNRLRTKQPNRYRDVEYTLFDASETLTTSQRQLCADHEGHVSFIVGDIEGDVFSESYDLIIANEMIADLSVEAITRNDIERGRSEAARLVRSFGLDYDSAPERFIVNTGALRLVEKLPSMLNVGGHAVLTEYGSNSEFPMPVPLPGHTEHSIHFGHLQQVARQLNLRSRCESLIDYLEFDTTVEVLSNLSLNLLRHLSPALIGPSVASLSYDRAQLQQLLGDALTRTGNLSFLPVSSTETFMSPSSFLALELSK